MAEPLFGKIKNPLQSIDPAGYGEINDPNAGLVVFMSNIIKVITIGAGVFAFVNLIIAGFTYISAGNDSKKTSEAWSKIYMSLIGLLIIVSSFAIAGIVGQLMYGDPSAILNPKIYGPGTIN